MSAVSSAEPARSILGENLREFRENRLAVAAAGMVVFITLLAAFAPWIAPHDPYETDLFRRLLPPAWEQGGDWAHLLGCDALGRDVLSRLIYGSRVSIAVGLAVILIATTIGTIAGLVAGYLRGVPDAIISRLCDILLGFPYLIFAIGLIAMTGPGFQNIILALAYKEWVLPCRVVRGETLAARGNGVYRSGEGAGCIPDACHAQGNPAQHPVAGIGGCDLPHGPYHHHRSQSLVPRHRRAATDRILGLHGG